MNVAEVVELLHRQLFQVGGEDNFSAVAKFGDPVLRELSCVYCASCDSRALSTLQTFS